MKLSDLAINESAVILSVESRDIAQSTFERLQEMGFIAGETVIPKHRGLGGSSRVYEVRGSLIALRRAEAAYISVEVSSQ